MSAARARANHELYLARIVLTAWRDALQLEEVPASVLTQAFEPGTREHLVAAYGWFLLAVSNAEALPALPPRGTAELPPMPEGKVFPGEINEFRQLETQGWLAALLRPGAIDLPAPRQPGNLALASLDLPATDQLGQWLEELTALFERMGDSLDEY